MNKGPNPKIATYARRRYDVRFKEIENAGEKLCACCEKNLPLDAFEHRKRRHKGTAYSSWCRQCAVKQRYFTRIFENYLLTKEKRDAIFAYQKDCCALCDKHMSFFRRGLAIDHDHATGLVRGALCWHCNRLLSTAQEDIIRLVKAARYLCHPPAIEALGEHHFGLPGRISSKINPRRKKAQKLAINREELIQKATKVKELKELNAIIKYLDDPPARKVIGSQKMS